MTYGDGHIDTNLAGLNLTLESLGCAAGACEYGRAVAVLVGVYHVDGIVDGWDIEANKDRSEDLLGVASHVRLDVGYDGWSDL